MKKMFYSILAVGLLYLVACNPQPEAALLLKQADSIVETHPDSALLLVDSIFYPEKSLNRKAYMRLLVLRVQAKYKTYRPIDGDTLVFLARDYFSGQGRDSHMSALAWFYSGCVFREQKRYEKAAEHYLAAAGYATETGDAALRGLIRYNLGDLFAMQDLYAEALVHYKEAERFYAWSPEQPYEKQTTCLAAIGRMFLLDKKTDSAFWYFHKGLELAGTKGDRQLQALLSQNIAITYRENGQYGEAETYLHQSFSANADSTAIPRYYLNFARLYAGMGQPDSAALYAGKLNLSIDSSGDNYFKASAYQFLAEWEKAMGNYEKASGYQDKRINSLNRIMSDQRNQSVYEAGRKYDYAQQQNRYNLRFIRFQQWIMVLMGVAIIVAGGFLFIFRRMLRERAAKLKMQENVNTLRATTKDLLSAEKEERMKETALKEALLWKLEVLKDTMRLKFMTGGKDRETYRPLFNRLDKILFDKNTTAPWMCIRQTVEDLNPGLRIFIRRQYPALSETEYNVCLLSYAGLSVQEAAFALNQSEHTIYKARTGLNKKIGADFCSVLRKALNFNPSLHR